MVAGISCWHSSVLSVYSLGLLFFSLQKVLSSVFFAKGDTRTPVFSSLFALAVFILVFALCVAFAADRIVYIA